MVKVLNNMIQGKGKVIAVAIALVVTGFSALLVMLTNISMAIKIAITAVVIAVAIFTYLGLSIPSFIKKFRAKKNDVSTNNKKQPDVSGDEGYDSANGSEDEDEDKAEDIVIFTKEQEKTEFQVQEEECKRMEQGSLGGSIDALGNSLPDQVTLRDTQSGRTDYRKIMVMSEKIVLGAQASNEQNTGQDDKSQTQYEQNYMDFMNKPTPNLNGFYETIPNKFASTENIYSVGYNDDSLKTTTEEHIVRGDQVSNKQSASQDGKSQTQCRSYQGSYTPSTVINEPKPQGKLLSAQELLSELQKEYNEALENQRRRFAERIF